MKEEKKMEEVKTSHRLPLVIEDGADITEDEVNNIPLPKADIAPEAITARQACEKTILSLKGTLTVPVEIPYAVRQRDKRTWQRCRQNSDDGDTQTAILHWHAFQDECPDNDTLVIVRWTEYDEDDTENQCCVLDWFFGIKERNKRVGRWLVSDFPDDARWCHVADIIPVYTYKRHVAQAQEIVLTNEDLAAWMEEIGMNFAARNKSSAGGNTCGGDSGND